MNSSNSQDRSASSSEQHPLEQLKDPEARQWVQAMRESEGYRLFWAAGQALFNQHYRRLRSSRDPNEMMNLQGKLDAFEEIFALPDKLLGRAHGVADQDLSNAGTSRDYR
jgi:hypothetical protein